MKIGKFICNGIEKEIGYEDKKFYLVNKKEEKEEKEEFEYFNRVYLLTHPWEKVEYWDDMDDGNDENDENDGNGNGNENDDNGNKKCLYWNVEGLVEIKICGKSVEELVEWVVKMMKPEKCG